MLVIPPTGDIEQVEWDENHRLAFARMQKEASCTPPRPAHLERVPYTAIDDVMLFVDEEGWILMPVTPPNERASALAKQNIYGPAVVCGPDISGMTLDRALQVRKMIEGLS